MKEPKYNEYLWFTESSKEETPSEEEKKFIRNFIRNEYIKTVEFLKEKNTKPQVDRAIEKYGETAVLKSGYETGGYDKPVILTFEDFDCYGDRYVAPIIVYADGIYDYKGFDKEELLKYLKGYNYNDIALAAGGAILLESLDHACEQVAKDLLKPRTYRIQMIPKTEGE